jgi:hypothetical protein
MNVIEYLNKNGILWEPINLINKIPSKISDYMPKTSDYQLDPQIIKQRQSVPSKYIGIFTNIVQQYDIDFEGYENDKFKNCPHFKSVTRQLPHYFFYISDAMKKQCPVKGGDILNGNWSYAARNAIVYDHDKNIPTFSLSDIGERVKMSELKNVINVLKGNINEYSYDDWINICFGIYNTAYENGLDGYTLIHDFSKNGNKYDDKAVDTINNLSYKKGGINFPSLIDRANEIKGKKKKSEKTKENSDEGTEVDYDSWKLEWENHIFCCTLTNLVCNDTYKDVEIMEEQYHPLKKWYFYIAPTLLALNNSICSKTKTSCVYIWNSDPNKRQYLDYTFSPYPHIENNTYSYYNTWNDFELSNYKINEDKELEHTHVVSMYRDFKMHLACGDKKVFDYLLQIDAHTVQRPGEKIGVAVVIVGSSGTGKGTETSLQLALVGQEYAIQVTDIETILGKFTSTLSRKLVVILDEAVPKNMFDKDGPLKSLITEPYTKIEKKGKDARKENSFVRLIITSNSDNVVKIPSSDRRFLIINPLIYEAGNEYLYPHTIFDLIKDKDCMKIIFDYLKTIKIKYSNIQEWQTNRPITEEYEDMREASIPYHIQFLYHFIDSRPDGTTTFDMSTLELYSNYKTFVGDNKKWEMGYTDFCRKLRKIEGFSFRRMNSNATKITMCTINIAEFNNFLTKEKMVMTSY